MAAHDRLPCSPVSFFAFARRSLQPNCSAPITAWHPAMSRVDKQGMIVSLSTVEVAQMPTGPSCPSMGGEDGGSPSTDVYEAG